ALRLLTDTQRMDLKPDWSPTGGWIAYSSGQAQPEIRVVRPDGTEDRPVTNNQVYDDDASFSPTGSRIAYMACNQNDRCQIFIKSIFGGQRRQFTFGSKAHFEPTWSPIGTRIAWVE